MRPPGPLIAQGRDSDIFDYGPGLVLRRSRHARSMIDEARVMEHARAEGYPVPAVSEVSADGTEMVMQRVEGPSMMAALSRRPWTLRDRTRVLADLHHRLHDITAPGWLGAAPGSPGDRLLHLDLHPLNIMLAAAGPVVIDWTNARRGLPETDVALTWVLLASGDIPTGRLRAAVLGQARRVLLDRFLSYFDIPAVTAELRGVVEWKVTDDNMSPVERQRMWRLVDSAATG